MPVAQELAGIYAHGTLDVLVELTEAIAKDLRQNPNRYRGKDPAKADDLVDKLSQFAHLGTAPAWPDREERAQLYSAHLGQSDAKPGAKDVPDDFKRYGLALRNAARQFVERSENAKDDQLKNRVVETALDFQQYLLNKEGASLKLHAKSLEDIFTITQQIQQNEELAGAFGKQAPKNTWPLDDKADPKGNELVQVISSQLKERLEPSTRVVLDKIAMVQKVAVNGNESVTKIVDGDRAKFADPAFIETVYKWHRALRDYHGKDE